MSKKTKCVVFQNSKLTLTFDVYVYWKRYIQEYKAIGKNENRKRRNEEKKASCPRKDNELSKKR